MSEIISITENEIIQWGSADGSRKRTVRAVRVTFEGIPPAQPRQNRATRHAADGRGNRASRYNDWRATMRDELWYALRENGIERFGKVRLQLKVELWFLSEAERRKCDLKNQIATIEDCLGRDYGKDPRYPDGILIYDDKWIDRIEETERLIGPHRQIVFEIREL